MESFIIEGGHQISQRDWKQESSQNNQRNKFLPFQFQKFAFD